MDCPGFAKCADLVVRRGSPSGVDVGGNLACVWCVA